MGILATLLIAMALAILPMPAWAIWFRPAWVLMVLIYWGMSVPHRVSVGVAWFTGLVVDLMSGTVLGEHALAYTVVIYLVGRLHMRLRLYPLTQQALTVFMLVLLYQLIIFIIQGFVGEAPSHYLYWMAALSSMLLWPWLYIILRDYRRWLHIA